MRVGKIVICSIVALVAISLASAATVSLKSIDYRVTGQVTGSEIVVNLSIYSPQNADVWLMFEVVRDKRFAFDEVVYKTFEKVSLSAGDNQVTVRLLAPDQGSYFIRVYLVDNGKLVRLDPWQILGTGRPAIEILGDNPAVENSRTVTTFPYTITDTVTYRIRYDTPYGGPTYCDRYFIPMKAGYTYVIQIEAQDNPFMIYFKKENGNTVYEGYTTAYTKRYSPTKDYTAELRIYPKGDPTDNDDEITTYTLTIQEGTGTPLPTATPTPSIVPITTPTPAPSQGIPGFEAVFAVVGLIAVSYLLRRPS